LLCHQSIELVICSSFPEQANWSSHWFRWAVW